MQLLERHPWPGNVRELANIVERTAIVHPGAEIGVTILAGILGQQTDRTAVPAATIEEAVKAHGGLAEVLDKYERDMIESALRIASGNIAEAARWLNTDRPNLYRRMKRLGIEGSRSPDSSAKRITS
jgi:two-component system nitrogen regulation response regulator NtrX